jgi:predicted lactoylglutathione lyase
MLAVSCDSREAVDAMNRSPITAAHRRRQSAQDLGFMYNRNLADPTATSEAIWMKPA